MKNRLIHDFGSHHHRFRMEHRKHQENTKEPFREIENAPRIGDDEKAKRGGE